MSLVHVASESNEADDPGVQEEWVTGPTISLAQLARKHGLSPVVVRARARREHWVERRTAHVAACRRADIAQLRRRSVSPALLACQALVRGFARQDRPERLAQLAREAADACNAVAAYHTMNNALVLVVFHDLIPGVQRLPFHALLPLHLFA